MENWWKIGDAYDFMRLKFNFKNGDGVDSLRFLRKKENIGPLYLYTFKPLPY